MVLQHRNWNTYQKKKKKKSPYTIQALGVVCLATDGKGIVPKILLVPASCNTVTLILSNLALLLGQFREELITWLSCASTFRINSARGNLDVPAHEEFYSGRWCTSAGQKEHELYCFQEGRYLVFSCFPSQSRPKSTFPFFLKRPKTLSFHPG